MNKKSHNKYLLISIIFFALACSLFFFLYEGVKNNQRVYKEAEMAWQREEDRLAEIRLIDRSIKDVQVEKSEFESHFARKSDVVPFLDSLERLASSVGTTAEVSSVDTTTDNMTLSLTMRASGSFDSIYRFLTLLENSYYVLEVNNFSMQRDTFVDVTGNQSAKWKSVINIKLLSYLDE